MGNFAFGNDFNLDFSRIKAGSRIDVKNEELKKYDKNGNSIWDSSEIEELKKDVSSGKINVSTTNISANSDINFVNKNRYQSYYEMQLSSNSNEKQERYERNKDVAGAVLMDRANAACEIVEVSRGGAISKGWNGIKELLGSDMRYSRVNRQLANSRVSAMLIDKAKDGGMSKKQYIECKVRLLEELLGADNLSPLEQAQIRRGINSLTPDQLDSVINSLVNADDKSFAKISSQQTQKLLKAGEGHVIDRQTVYAEYPKGSIGKIMESTDETLSFEQIYKNELGVPFLQENIEKYQDKAQEFRLLSMVFTKISEMKDYLSIATKKMENKIKARNNGGIITQKDAEDYGQLVAKTLNDTFGGDSQKISEFLSKIGHGDIELVSGICFSPLDLNAIVDISNALQSELDSKLEDVLGGKTLEEHMNELSECYKDTFGDNPVNLANEFKDSQEAGVEGFKIVTTVGGIVLAIASDGLLLPLVGGVVAGFGAVGIDAVESATKAGGMTDEDKSRVRAEFKEALLLFAAGAGIGAATARTGKLAMESFKAFAKSHPFLMKMFAEYGPDAILSCVADLMITGEVDVSAETLSETINILAGIVSHHKARSHINEGGTHVRDNPWVTSNSNQVSDNVSSTATEPISGVKRRINSNQALQASLAKYGIDVSKLDDENLRYIDQIANDKTLRPADKERLLQQIGSGKPLVSEDGMKVKLDDVKTPTKEQLQKRQEVLSEMQSAAPDELNELRKILGDEYFNAMPWENLFPTTPMPASIIKNTLSRMTHEAKMFARTSVNEGRYGKNFEWAHSMGDISDKAVDKLRNGGTFDDVMNGIASDYHDYDSTHSSSIDRDKSGVLREPLPFSDGSGYGDYCNTPYDREAYNEYKDRFDAAVSRDKKWSGPPLKSRPYENDSDIKLTTVKNGLMKHPNAADAQKAMNYVKQKYDSTIVPLVQKVKNGGTLSKSEINTIHETLAECYYILANNVPYERGTNGICDILIRSTYEALGIDMPPLKQGVSLDLEAMTTKNFNEYKNKWKNGEFFEN